MSRELLDSIVIHPGRRLACAVVALLATPDPENFETAEVDSLELTLEGVAGDRHAGFTRASGAREPWHRRGTEIRSGRQISIVSKEELWEIGYAMGLPPIEPGWIGANVVVEGVARLSFLPSGARLFLEGDAVLVVEGQNAPCGHSGRSIARHTERPGDELTFPKVARRLRGLVATVERAGAARAGAATFMLPEQWIY